LANVQEYEAPATIDPLDARRRLREALGVIAEVLEIPATQLFFRVRRRQKGKEQYQRLDSQRRFFQVQEGGLNFLVNFEDYLDTGLFLDHREVRRLIGKLAAGRRFLNLFGYTEGRQRPCRRGRCPGHHHGGSVTHLSGLGGSQSRPQRFWRAGP
ncbi:MAG TPA: class I SAM-dependent methyltransferase, partial [Chromatiaceae bacterium]|nr:class I SAM-dependent methyltransferase [Chromatiaceae bacterium]